MHPATPRAQKTRSVTRKRPFVHKMFVHNFCAPYPPPPNQQSDRFPLEFLFEGPQTELRTLGQNCEQTLQKLRTNRIMSLAAQCEIPPPYRAIPFRDRIAEGGLAPISLVFIGYRASIAEIPLLWGGGYRTSTSHALQGGNAQKRGRGYRTQLAMMRHEKLHSAQ